MCYLFLLLTYSHANTRMDRKPQHTCLDASRDVIKHKWGVQKSLSRMMMIANIVKRMHWKIWYISCNNGQPTTHAHFNMRMITRPVNGYLAIQAVKFAPGPRVDAIGPPVVINTSRLAKISAAMKSCTFCVVVALLSTTEASCLSSRQEVYEVGKARWVSGLAAWVTLVHALLRQWQDTVAFIINHKRTSLSPDAADCLIFLYHICEVCCCEGSCSPAVLAPSALAQ